MLLRCLCISICCASVNVSVFRILISYISSISITFIPNDYAMFSCVVYMSIPVQNGSFVCVFHMSRICIRFVLYLSWLTSLSLFLYKNKILFKSLIESVNNANSRELSVLNDFPLDLIRLNIRTRFSSWNSIISNNSSLILGGTYIIFITI